ncbi:hypothetical protein GCM10020000_86370 [Streptomyces olivoverticillatus]
MPDLTISELGRRYKVAHSTVARAMARATALRADGHPVPAPPAPVNPGEPQLRYPADKMDAWWSKRPPRGRPRTSPPTPTTT